MVLILVLVVSIDLVCLFVEMHDTLLICDHDTGDIMMMMGIHGIDNAW